MTKKTIEDRVTELAKAIDKAMPQFELLRVALLETIVKWFGDTEDVVMPPGLQNAIVTAAATDLLCNSLCVDEPDERLLAARIHLAQEQVAKGSVTVRMRGVK